MIDHLITSFLKLLEKSSSDNRYLIEFPSFINIIKTKFFNAYDHFQDNAKENTLYNLIFYSHILIFDYTFKRQKYYKETKKIFYVWIN